MIFSVIIAQCGVILDTVVKDDKEVSYIRQISPYNSLHILPDPAHIIYIKYLSHDQAASKYHEKTVFA